MIERNDRRLKELGTVPEALGWTRDRHLLRFDVLLSHWNLHDESVLDFGCGFADMCGFCQEQYPAVRYSGIDVNPSLINAGRQQRPDADLRAINVFRDPVEESWDVIVASGVFNLKLDDTWGFIEDAFRFFSAHARKGFAANFLSNRVDYELADTFHADPPRVLDLAYRYSNRVTLRNDYMPFEFTVFVDLRREFDQTSVVYPEYLPLVHRAARRHR